MRVYHDTYLRHLVDGLIFKRPGLVSRHFKKMRSNKPKLIGFAIYVDGEDVFPKQRFGQEDANYIELYANSRGSMEP